MRFVLAMACLCLLSVPASAQSREELEAELAAQKELNLLLKQRIETLESRLAGRTIAPPSPNVSSAPVEQGDPETERALARALERRGASVLPAGILEITPGTFWAHSGRDALATRDDLIGGSIDVRIGAGDGWMLGANLPLLHRDIQDVGQNSGIGDISVAVWKSLMRESSGRPSLVGNVRYKAPTGDDFLDDPVPLGNGFHSVSGQLVAVKTFDPIAFYGEVAYTHPFAERISGVDVDRTGVASLGFGANLAVTPEINTSAGFAFAFEGAAEIDGTEVGGDTTIGQLDLGLGILLSRNVFLTLSGAIGLTEDSPDIVIGASLPIRF